MTRKLRRAAVALVAVGAVAAVGAGSASADEFWFKSDGDPTTISGAQIGSGHVFTTDAGEVQCDTVVYTGTETYGETETVVELAPEVSGCAHSLGTLEVDHNDCTYTFEADTATGGNEYHVNTSIDCPTGQEITVTAKAFGVTKCTIHVPAQNLGTGMVLTNDEVEGVEDITAHIDFHNIKYSETPGSGIGKCSATEDTEDGTYIGEATLAGENEGGEPTDIWVE